MIDFEDGSLALAKRQLAALDLRAKVVLHNIANQNTPGYKRYDVSFEERMREASQSADARRDVEPVVLRDESGAPGINNVSIMRIGSPSSVSPASAPMVSG